MHPRAADPPTWNFPAPHTVHAPLASVCPYPDAHTAHVSVEVDWRYSGLHEVQAPVVAEHTAQDALRAHGLHVAAPMADANVPAAHGVQAELGVPRARAVPRSHCVHVVALEVAMPYPSAQPLHVVPISTKPVVQDPEHAAVTGSHVRQLGQGSTWLRQRC